MKLSLYPRLALDGMRKNKRLYLPYILTCTGMVMMFYIIAFLRYDTALDSIGGGENLRIMLSFGCWVIALFACIFLFYTNSFLIRRRKKEFALYNVLGMGRKNIGFVLFWEALFISAASLICGNVLGAALSKLAELGLVRITGNDASYAYYISGSAILMSVAVFGVIFALIFLNSLHQIRHSTAASLLKSENLGEKPPKANWLLGILGLVLLGWAYYTAATIEDALSALTLFFIAVLAVIVAAYMLMVSGSVLLCRILQKNRDYYYTPRHFVSVSSMAFRMKRNGAGLASICILATMVLVTLSSTASLYFGADDAIKSRYPRNIDLSFGYAAADELSEERLAPVTDAVIDAAGKFGVSPDNIYDYRCAGIVGYMKDGVVDVNSAAVDNFTGTSFSDVYQFDFIPLSDYNAQTGENRTLGDGEALVYTYRADTGKLPERISFKYGQSFDIADVVNDQLDNIDSADAAMNIIPTITLVVPDLASAVAGLDELYDSYDNAMLKFSRSYYFDIDADEQTQIELCQSLRDTLRAPEAYDGFGYASCTIECQAENRSDFFSTFGGLFYLGAVLSVVFIIAAVLIIYYKQISEGYEDQSRFEIMQKVGMTKPEIRKSINSQLLTVFFLPLAGAGLNLLFAFPMIRQLLMLFNLHNTRLFALTTLISFIIFALLYTLVYRITSNAYFGIVAGAKED